MVTQYQTGGQSLSTFFNYLQQYGFIDVLLPALLIFAVIFGILQKIAMFKTAKLEKKTDKDGKTTWEPAKDKEGKDIMVGDRKINGILAILIALAVVIPHAARVYPVGLDPVILIYQFLPNTAVILIAILAVVLLFGLSGTTHIPSSLQLLLGIIAAGLLVFLIAVAVFPGFFSGFSFLRDPSVQAVLVIVLIAGLVIYFALREGGGEPMHKKVREWMTERVPPVT